MSLLRPTNRETDVAQPTSVNRDPEFAKDDVPTLLGGTVRPIGADDNASQATASGL